VCTDLKDTTREYKRSDKKQREETNWNEKVMWVEKAITSEENQKRPCKSGGKTLNKHRQREKND